MSRRSRIFNIIYIILFVSAIVVCIDNYSTIPHVAFWVIIAWLASDTIKAIMDLVRK